MRNAVTLGGAGKRKGLIGPGGHSLSFRPLVRVIAQPKPSGAAAGRDAGPPPRRSQISAGRRTPA
ncbi:hypothetical protein Ssi03_13710 [Sphaerisporangium siamense]|nr:hypothetical protein Ssi03_13710 [Sphaerisporangium siamense]